MGHDLSDKVAVVTGAGRGIGKAIAEAMAKAGARVVLWGRSETTLASVAEDLRAAGHEAGYYVCDVSRLAEVEAASVALTGPVDILVNNAGISGDETFALDISEEAWDAVIDTNLKGPFLCSKVIGRRMKDQGGGTIVNTASISGLGMDGAFVHYSASKAGLLALTRGMAVELAPHGIRVNAVSPGYTRTEMTTQYFGPHLQHVLDRDFRRVPMRRVIETHEVASAFVYLASDAASGITGANLVVDGGVMGNLYILETLPPADSG